MNLNNILKQAFKDNTNSQGVTFQPRFIDQAKKQIQELMLGEEEIEDVLLDRQDYLTDGFSYYGNNEPIETAKAISNKMKKRLR